MRTNEDAPKASATPAATVAVQQSGVSAEKQTQEPILVKTEDIHQDLSIDLTTASQTLPEEHPKIIGDQPSILAEQTASLTPAPSTEDTKVGQEILTESEALKANVGPKEGATDQSSSELGTRSEVTLAQASITQPSTTETAKPTEVTATQTPSIRLGTHQITASQSAPHERTSHAEVLSKSSHSQKNTAGVTPAAVQSKTPMNRIESDIHERPNLPARLDSIAQPTRSDQTPPIAQPTIPEKRKRGHTPPARNADEPPTNRAKTAVSSYDRFAKQRREPSLEAPANQDSKTVVTNKTDQNTKASSEVRGKNDATKDDEMVPAACTSDLACLFVGNIPPSAKDSDMKPWLLSAHTIPSPVVVTHLGHARSTPNAQQYLRVFYQKKTQAEHAMRLLKNVPFGSPPAQLFVKMLELKPEKVKLHWRDVESWARPVLEAKLKPKSGVAALPKRPEESGPVQLREGSRELTRRDLEAADRYRDTRRSRSPPRRRLTSPPRDPYARDADRLADRLREDPRDFDRRDYNTARRPSLSERTQSSSSLPKSRMQEDRSPRDDLATRIREPEHDSYRPRSSWPDDRRRQSRDDVFRRFDASPPRKSREPGRYSPDRDTYRTQGSNLLGRLQ